MHEINQKLKTELIALIEKLESALLKFKDRKEKDKSRGANAGYYGAYKVTEDQM